MFKKLIIILIIIGIVSGTGGVFHNQQISKENLNTVLSLANLDKKNVMKILSKQGISISEDNQKKIMDLLKNAKNKNPEKIKKDLRDIFGKDYEKELKKVFDNKAENIGDE